MVKIFKTVAGGLCALVFLATNSCRNDDNDEVPAVVLQPHASDSRRLGFEPRRFPDPSGSPGRSSETPDRRFIWSDHLEGSQIVGRMVKPGDLKETLIKRFPKRNRQCLKMASSLRGQYDWWDFNFYYWLFNGSSERYSSQRVSALGYQFIKRLFPVANVLKINDQRQELVSELFFTKDYSPQSVVWDIFPNVEGKNCIMLQDIHQRDALSPRAWIVIELDSQDVQGDRESLFHWYDDQEYYRAFGKVIFRRSISDHDGYDSYNESDPDPHHGKRSEGSRL